MRGKLLFGAAGAAFIALAFAAPAALGQEADQPGDASTTATLPLGQDVAGELSPAQDTDWYRLRVEQGQRYRLTLDAAPADGEAAIDPVVVLYDREGAQLAFNDDAGGTLNSALAYTPAQSGDIFVEARGFDPAATGRYRLHAAAEEIPPDDAGNDQRTRARVTPGQPVSGTIEYEGDTDWYRISVRTGQVYRISLAGAQGENPLQDPLLRVVTRGGEELAFNDDFTSLDSYLDFAPTRSGEVFIEARGFADVYTGAYTLIVETERLPPDAAAAGVNTRGRIGVGQSVDAVLEYSGDRDWYRIRLEQGETYRFALASSGEPPLGDPLLRVFDARGEEMGMDDDGGGALNSLLEFTAPATGNFYLEASAYGDNAPGGYTLRAAQGDIPADASTDVSLSAEGDFREGILSPAGDRDWYRIELTEGQSLRISVVSAEIGEALADPYVVLYGPDGAEVGRDDDGGGGLNAWLEHQAAASGAYHLEVRGFDEGASGRYMIGIAPGEIGGSPDGAEQIVVNTMRTSIIGAPDDADWFVLEMIEGRPYRINIVGFEDGGLADPYLRLYNAAGEEIAADDDGGTGFNAYLSFASPTGGPHFVAVSAYGGEGGGRYGVYVTDTEVPGHVYTDEGLNAADDSRASRIEMPGDLDYYGVALEGGVSYQIEVRGDGDHPLADPFLTIVDAENTRVNSDDDGGDGLDARLRFTPRESGVFFLQASGLGGSTGTYQISIVRR